VSSDYTITTVLRCLALNMVAVSTESYGNSLDQTYGHLTFNLTPEVTD